MSYRSYTKEFKAEAVKMVTEQGLTQSSVANSLGVSSRNINRWVLESTTGIMPSHKAKTRPAAEEEVHKLKKLVNKLAMEKDILKKAIAFFARES